MLDGIEFVREEFFEVDLPLEEGIRAIYNKGTLTVNKCVFDRIYDCPGAFSADGWLSEGGAVSAASGYSSRGTHVQRYYTAAV